MTQEDKDNADRDESGSLLSEAESAAWEIIGSRDLPKVDKPVVENRPAPKPKKTRAPKNLTNPLIENQALISIIGYVANKKLGRKADAAFEQSIVKRMVLYRCDALDALHDLATMPITENATANHLKYLAACRLTGNVDGTATQAGDNLPETLRKLNEAYLREAPRIKEIRERVVEFEQEPKVIN